MARTRTVLLLRAIVSWWALATARLRPVAPRVSLRVANLDDAEGMLRHARDAAANGRMDEALAGLSAASVARPDLAVAHFGRGVCLADLGRHEEAHAALARAHALAPHEPHHALELARACARTGRRAQALALASSLLVELPFLAGQLRADPAFASFADHPVWLAMVGAL